MNRGLKIRLVAFVLAIAGMMASIAFTAHISWQRTGQLRERLTLVQMESFRIADRFQQTILGLNNSVLRFGLQHSSADWDHFATESKNLDRWIDEQGPVLPTKREKQILDQINVAYDDYVRSAEAIESKVKDNPNSATKLNDFSDFEREGQRLLALGFELARAHRESLDTFLAASNKSLLSLRYVLLICLGLLALAGAGLAAAVYRDLISPLRIKLVESQALMERQEKLASLGMLATGVAHEIRNPLTAIKAWLFIQQKHLKPGTPEYEDSQVISEEISRLERIVKDVLLFARPSEPQLRLVPADEPLREAQTLMAPDLEKAHIQLLVEASSKSEARMDLQQMKQVLINLIKNAADSIGKDGTITLRSRDGTKRLGDRLTEVVILEVEDTGKGIPPEVEKRLFDPFFTTKESGTGLGLSIAARIVEKHGGALMYQTQLNKGTAFGIVLPRA